MRLEYVFSIIGRSPIERLCFFFSSWCCVLLFFFCGLFFFSFFKYLSLSSVPRFVFGFRVPIGEFPIPLFKFYSCSLISFRDLGPSSWKLFSAIKTLRPNLVLIVDFVIFMWVRQYKPKFNPFLWQEDFFCFLYLTSSSLDTLGPRFVLPFLSPS